MKADLFLPNNPKYMRCICDNIPLHHKPCMRCRFIKHRSNRYVSMIKDDRLTDHDKWLAASELAIVDLAKEFGYKEKDKKNEKDEPSGEQEHEAHDES